MVTPWAPPEADALPVALQRRQAPLRMRAWLVFVQRRRSRRGDPNIRWRVGPHAPRRPLDWARIKWGGRQCGCRHCRTLGEAKAACAALATGDYKDSK